MATKRSLATKLGVVAGFERPDAALEQYPTPPELAAHVVHLADLHGDVDGRTVIDLGTGTGMLALAAALRGPARVVGASGSSLRNILSRLGSCSVAKRVTPALADLFL